MSKGDFQMRLTNEQLKSIYFGALHFKETEGGYLQAFQYTDSQMDYFRNSPFTFWSEQHKHILDKMQSRCDGIGPVFVHGSRRRLLRRHGM